MAKIQPIIDNYIRTKCVSRGYKILGSGYTFPYRKGYSAMLVFSGSNYNVCRTETVTLGVCNDEIERLLGILHGQTERFKKTIRFSVYKTNIGYCMPECKYRVWNIDENASREDIEKTCDTIFDELDTYLPILLDRMCNLSRIKEYTLQQNYMEQLLVMPIIYMMEGNKQKGVSLINEIIELGASDIHYHADFIKNYMEYDYESDDNRIVAKENDSPYDTVRLMIDKEIESNCEKRGFYKEEQCYSKSLKNDFKVYMKFYFKIYPTHRDISLTIYMQNKKIQNVLLDHFDKYKYHFKTMTLSMASIRLKDDSLKWNNPYEWVIYEDRPEMIPLVLSAMFDAFDKTIPEWYNYLSDYMHLKQYLADNPSWRYKLMYLSALYLVFEDKESLHQLVAAAKTDGYHIPGDMLEALKKMYGYPCR